MAGYREWLSYLFDLMGLVLQDGSVNGVARTTTEDDAFYRTTRDPLEVDEEGIEMSSAPVTYGDLDKKGKGVVRKVDSEDAEAPGELLHHFVPFHHFLSAGPRLIEHLSLLCTAASGMVVIG